MNVWHARRRRQRNTYIVPTPLGGAFLVCNVVLFLMAAVYRNDILYVHGFALLSLFFLAMIQTHGNLRALVLKGLPLSDPFAGGRIHLGHRTRQSEEGGSLGSRGACARFSKCQRLQSSEQGGVRKSRGSCEQRAR